MKHKITVEKGYDGMRLDLFLTLNFDQYSRSFLKKQIEQSRVEINGEKQFRANYKVREGDLIQGDFEKLQINTNVQGEDIALDIAYEDSDLIMINKPAGMVVHPATGNFSGTLVNALLYKFSELKDVGKEIRTGLINRIDKETSGLVLVGKSNKALWFYTRQFANREVEKYYLAIVDGDFRKALNKTTSIQINNYLDRNPVHRKKYSVVPDGKGRLASTEFSLVAVGIDSKYSLVLARPKTGRTHQIRVHLNHLGFPIVGDDVYGGSKSSRLMLHSYRIKLKGLNGDQIDVKAKLEKRFDDFLKQDFDYKSVCKDI